MTRRRIVRIADKVHIVLDQRSITADTTFFLTNRHGKRYGGNIINEGGGNLLVQVLSTGGFFSQFKTLTPNSTLNFYDYPLSAITVRLPAGVSSGIISILAWAAFTPQGSVYLVPPAATTTPAVSQPMFYALSPAITVLAAGQTATAGLLWLYNPIASTIRMFVKSIILYQQPTAVTAFASAPRINIERMTFTPSNGAGLITPAKKSSAQAAAQGLFGTGAPSVITAGAGVHAFRITPVLTAAGYSVTPNAQLFLPKVSDEEIILLAGEGLVIRQPDAGTAADTRSFNINAVWGETA